MEITINELLNGKSTRIKNNDYLPTEAYVTPFLDRLSSLTDDFRVEVKLPDQITKTKDGDINTEDITYNRVWVQAVLPNYIYDNHTEVIGMVYGIDVRKPVVKFYKGGLNMACTNLCIFNPDLLQTREIAPELPFDYDALSIVLDKYNEMKTFLDNLKNTKFSYDNYNINESLGRWIRKTMEHSYENGYGKVKISANTPIDAYKLLFEDNKSPYYVDTDTDMFNVYNAFTQLISNDKGRDIMNKCEKTLLLSKILNV